MKHYNEMTIGKLAAIAAGIALLFVTSCKNAEEKQEKTTATVTQTDEQVKTGSSGTTGTTDPNVAATDNPRQPVQAGKPNPAKKGGKGKGTINWKPYTGSGNMEADKDGVYAKADIMPSYPGGEKALIKFMEDNIQYPQTALDEGVEGTVQLSFAVDEAGRIYTPVVKSDKIGYGLEDEAIRVIKKMPKWNPGSIKGKNVKTRFEIPVTYVIN